MCVIAKLPAHTNENANFSVGGRPVFRSGLFQLGAFSCSAHPTETLPLCPVQTPTVLPPIFPAVPPTDPPPRALQGSPSTAFQFLLRSHFLTEAGLLFYQNQLLPQPPHLGPNRSAPQPLSPSLVTCCPFALPLGSSQYSSHMSSCCKGLFLVCCLPAPRCCP